MQESTEPSLTKPVASEAQCDSANRAHSESRNSAPQSVVPTNFVEISLIPKVDSPGKEQEGEEETEVETDDKASSPGEEHMTGEGTPHGQEQRTTKEEALPSERALAAARKAFRRGALPELSNLVYEFAALRQAEKQAQRSAQTRAYEEEHRLTREDSDDQEDEEEFAEQKQSETQPDKIIINIGGRPAKTAELTDMEELIRRDGVIEAVQYVSAEDGIINQFSRRFGLSWDLWFLHQHLYDSLILPAGVQGFRTTRELFDGISALLHKHVLLPSKDCSLLAYWAIATWFTDYLPFLPGVIISGPASTADLLLRTLVAVCRRPVLLAELSPAILRKLPINELMPTLLIREPQLSRCMSALLNASNQPGYLFFSGKTFQQLYCPKCIYVGECFKDSPAASNSVHINLGGSALTPRHASPTKDEITSFQNRLFFIAY